MLALAALAEASRAVHQLRSRLGLGFDLSAWSPESVPVPRQNSSTLCSLPRVQRDLLDQVRGFARTAA
jgi:hypothetical protein